jgi:hypothetical protein
MPNLMPESWRAWLQARETERGKRRKILDRYYQHYTPQLDAAVIPPPGTLPCNIVVPDLGLDPDPQKRKIETVGHKPTPSLPQEFVAGPIVAWRAWKLKGTGLLWSTAMTDKFWPIGTPIRAQCSSGWHERYAPDIPKSCCQCGWYALRSKPEHARDVNNNTYHVIGQVALWGKVIAHEKGYRAEYAYPMSVELPTPMAGFPVGKAMLDDLQKVRDNYGCVVTVGGKELP